MPKDHGIGARPRRRDNARFLTGKGMDSDDRAMQGQGHGGGVQGIGEAGAIGHPPAGANAVIDALRRGGYTHVTPIDMPLSPSRVRAAMHG